MPCSATVAFGAGHIADDATLARGAFTPPAVKVVFSKTRKHLDGKNLRVENGDLAAAVNRLKTQPGKDIVVYGGATFVSSLLQRQLIDELHFFVNPVAIGRGMQLFKAKTPLTLVASTRYACGIVVNSYVRA